MPRNCRHVVRVDADISKFMVLYDGARACAGNTNRYVEVLPGHMAFNVETLDAYSKLYAFVASLHLRILTPGEDLPPHKMMRGARVVSEKFTACRERVHDDAFETQLALHMVSPLLSSRLSDIKIDYVYQSSLFLRRSIVRYLVLDLYGLLDKPNEKGKTGVTASIESLLEMARSEDILSDQQIKAFTAELEKIKAGGPSGEYDLVQAIRDLRNIQVAHSLIPHADPTDQLWAHDLVDFAEAVFRC